MFPNFGGGRRLAVDAGIKYSRTVDLNLDKLPDDYMNNLKDCAVLALQDHVVRNPDYPCGGLRVVKILKATSRYISGTRYDILFKASNDSHGEATFETSVWDTPSMKQVHNVRLGAEWSTGEVFVPKFSVDSSQTTFAFQGATLGEGTGATMSDDEDELQQDFSLDQSGASEAHDMMGFGPLLPTESERTLMDRVRQELKLELKQKSVTDEAVAAEFPQFPFKARPLCSTREAYAVDKCDSKTALIKQCAISAMQDYVLQEIGYSDIDLRLDKIIKATTLEDGLTFNITFEASNYSHGEATFEAQVYDDPIKRKVIFVRILKASRGVRNTKCYNGKLCVPKILVGSSSVAIPETTLDDSLPSQMDKCDRRGPGCLKMSEEHLSKGRETSSLGELLEADNEPATKRAKKSGKKAVTVEAVTVEPVAVGTELLPLEFPVMGSSMEAFVVDKCDSEPSLFQQCAILALQDHAVRNPDYSSIDLRLGKIIKATTSDDGFTFYIAFVASNFSHGTELFEAEVWDDSIKREVIRFRTLATSRGDWKDNWCDGKLCVPKFSVKLE